MITLAALYVKKSGNFFPRIASGSCFFPKNIDFKKLRNSDGDSILIRLRNLPNYAVTAYANNANKPPYRLSAWASSSASSSSFKKKKKKTTLPSSISF